MIVIGADVHKSTHALAAVDASTGQLLGEKEIPAKEQGHLDALRWAHELDAEIVWAIEDCRDLSHHLENALISAGERVIRVASKLMGVSRAANASQGSPTRSMPGRLPEPFCVRVSSVSRPRSSTRTPWRSGCCAITAKCSSTSAHG
jgi:transposase